MTILQQPPVASPPRLEGAGQEPHIFLSGVTWEGYEAFVRGIGAQRSLRITFDRGDMELMTISGRHDFYKHVLRRLVEILTFELDVPVRGYGSATLQRKDIERAIEADEWFYLESEHAVRGKLDLDMMQDPPPDLAIEIEISRSLLSRMPVYAAMKVPELWRFDGETLTAHVLAADGNYQHVERSPTFPNVPLEELVRFVHMAVSMSENDLVRAFRDWVRAHILPTWQPKSAGEGSA